MATHPLRAPSAVNHDVWYVLQDAFLGVSRIELALDQAHSFLLESGLDRSGKDAFDRVDAQLVACLALLKSVHAEMAVTCDPQAAGG